MEIKLEGSRARIVGGAQSGRYVCPSLARARRPRLRRAAARAALQSRSAGRRDARGRFVPRRLASAACHAGLVRCTTEHLRRLHPQSPRRHAASGWLDPVCALSAHPCCASCHWTIVLCFYCPGSVFFLNLSIWINGNDCE